MNSNHSSESPLASLLERILFQRAFLFGGLIMTALVAFELFNYTTTDFALGDLLGDLRFLGIRWATILAIAFCGIDFAGIARLFTPEQGRNEPAEVWYLFGAWLLAAGMNAVLTWWGVSLAIINHEMLGNAIIDRATLTKLVPVFVAAMVWLIRILIIGTFSVAGERLFSSAAQTSYRRPQPAASAPPPSYSARPLPERTYRPAAMGGQAAPLIRPASSLAVNHFRPAPKAAEPEEEPAYGGRPEPTYHPVSAKPAAPGGGPATRQ